MSVFSAKDAKYRSTPYRPWAPVRGLPYRGGRINNRTNPLLWEEPNFLHYCLAGAYTRAGLRAGPFGVTAAAGP